METGRFSVYGGTKTLLTALAAGVPVFLAVFLAAVVVFVFLMSFLGVVSPSLTDNAQVVQYIAGASIISVMGIPAFLQWLSRDDAAFAAPRRENEDARRFMIRTYCIRSRLFKVSSATAVFVMAVVALLSFTVVTPTTDVQTGGDVRSALSVGQGVGALLLLLVLLRTLGVIHRYTMRLAALYDGKADYLELGGSTETLSHKELLEFVAADAADSPRMGDLLRSLMGGQRGDGSGPGVGHGDGRR